MEQTEGKVMLGEILDLVSKIAEEYDVEMPAKYYHDMAHILSDEGKKEEAVEFFGEAARRRSRDPDYRICLGTALMDVQRYKEAIKHFNKAIRIDAKYGRPWYQKGLAYSRMGNLVQARRCMTRAIQLKQRESLCRTAMASILQGLKRHNEALENINQALELDRDSEDARIVKGRILLSLEKPKEALETFRKAQKLNPQSIDVHRGIGLSYSDLGRHKIALRYFDKILKLRPHDEVTLTQKASVLRNMGKRGLAIRYLRKALRVNPKYSLALCNLGASLVDSGRRREGLEYLRKGLRHCRLSKECKTVAHNLAVGLIESRDYSGALRYARKAARMAPKSVETWILLAETYAGLGREDEATKSLQRALRLNKKKAMDTIDEESPLQRRRLQSLLRRIR